MSKLKRDLSIYLLSASLVFLGISINSNQANAASASNAQLQSQIINLRNCLNMNVNTILNWDSKYDSKIQVHFC
jgi:hypothetical protein